MPESSQYDVRELENLVLPYDVTTKELDPRPRLVDGQNMYVTLGGKLAMRPGFYPYASIPSLPPALRPERLTIYRTVGDTYLTLVVSCRDTSIVSPTTYALEYFTVGVSVGWGLVATNYYSLAPHESLVINGKVYTRLEAIGVYSEFYNAHQLTTSALGTIGNSNWGVPALPTVSLGATVASAGAVTVRVGWKYAIAYESPTGHVSNRSAWVDTGAFTNLSRSINFTPALSALDAPYIRIYRTSDGGGLFTQVARVLNPGGASSWWDGSITPGAGTPVADTALDYGYLAPDMVVNSAPPARNYPVVYPDPAESHSNLAYFARRVWYGVKNRLYFSGQEEVFTGIPEECFPDPNGVRGNWYIFPHEIVSLKTTQDRLFIFTTDDIYVVLGEDRTNLRMVNFCQRLGMRSRMKLATAVHRDTVFFVGQDYNVWAIVGDNQPVNISLPVAATLNTAIKNSALPAQMVTWSGDGYTWLAVLTTGQLHVYDITRGFWFTPWNLSLFAATCMTTGRLDLTSEKEHLILMGEKDGGTGEWYTYYMKFDHPGDDIQPFPSDFTTNLLDLPAGNHVNMLRQPAHHPMLSYLKMERTKLSGDVHPTVAYRLDEFSGALTTVTPTDPPFLTTQSASYNTLWYPVQKVCQRVQIKASKGASGQGWEVQTVGLVFTPEAGA